MFEFAPKRFAVTENKSFLGQSRDGIRVTDQQTDNWFPIRDRSFEDVDDPFRELPSNLINHFVESKGAENVKVLEVGYGKGSRAANEIAQKHKNITVVSTDVVLSPVENEKGVHTVPSDVTQLPFRTGTFDVVYSREFLTFVEEGPGFEKEKETNQATARSIMKEITRVLADGGVAVVDDAEFCNLPDDDERLDNLEDDLRVQNLDGVLDVTLTQKDTAIYLTPRQRLIRLVEDPDFYKPRKMQVIQKGPIDPETQQVIDKVPDTYPRWRTR